MVNKFSHAVLIIGTLGGFMMLIMGYRIIRSNPLNEINTNIGISNLVVQF